MAIQGPSIYDASFKANADLSAKQYYLVKLTAAETVDLVAAVTDITFGVLQDKPKLGVAGTVRVLGRSKVVSDGTVAIAVGDKLASDASGRVVKNTTADRPVVGIALEASTAANIVISVLLTPGAMFRTAA